MAAQKVTQAKAEKVLALVAEWMGPKLGHIEICGECSPCLHGVDYDWQCDNPKPVPAPTGKEAAHQGLGPELNMTWDWPSSGPTPTILLEGGPDDWAMRVAGDTKFVEQMNKLGIFAEPYASYALCLYVA